jgi:hypothetical protein
MNGIGGAALVLAAVVLYGLVVAGFAWIMGGAARLGGPDDPRREP